MTTRNSSVRGVLTAAGYPPPTGTLIGMMRRPHRERTLTAVDEDVSQGRYKVPRRATLWYV
jgi:hypothetical protein